MKNTEYKAYCFDLDENLFNTWEVIFLWDTQENKSIKVNQHDYYHLIKEERYTHLNDDIETSMSNFRRWHWYLRDKLAYCYVKSRLGFTEYLWPSWDRFITAINNNCPIAIITARGHAIEEFQIAFDALFELMMNDWIITNKPKIFFYPVSNRDFCKKMNIAWETKVADKKAICFKDFLNKIAKQDWWKISIWFSDDSMVNVMQLMQFVLEENGKSEDSSNIEIEYNFYDTGRGTPQCLKFKWKLL